MKVLCINDTPTYGEPQCEWLIKKDETYEVAKEHIIPTFPNCTWYELTMQEGVAYPAEYFVPVGFTDITKELCDSIKQTDEVPDKILIPQTN